MSIKSIFQDMKEEFGSVSRKGYGFSSCSRQVVQDSVVSLDAFKEGCWANMPPELLRDMLMRIDASDGITWPNRRNVVVCAGVCRTWRDIMKEIVKTPEVSGKLTFPISLKQPGSRDTLIQCYIKRQRSSQTYYLFLGLRSASYNDGKFLLAAKRCIRPTCTDYIISLHPEHISKGGSTYIGKLRYRLHIFFVSTLRSNFLGTKYTIYDAAPSNYGAKITRSRSNILGSKQVVPTGNYIVSHISYDLNNFGSRGPRRMNCTMDTIPASAVKPGGSAPTQTEFVINNVDFLPSIPFFRSKSSRVHNYRSETVPNTESKILVLRNKDARWHEQLQCWCLNFNGRVTVASIKNFQLVACPENETEHESVVLQFGKVEKDVFTMDYRYPISAFQAFAICLSSFDTRVARE